MDFVTPYLSCLASRGGFFLLFSFVRPFKPLHNASLSPLGRCCGLELPAHSHVATSVEGLGNAFHLCSGAKKKIDSLLNSVIG